MINYVYLLISIIYIFLPMQKINEYIFKIPEIDEEENYENIYLTFDTVNLLNHKNFS